MLGILVFTIHFAALYSINCAFSQSNSRTERRENEKKPFDRIEGRKCMMKFLGENIRALCHTLINAERVSVHFIPYAYIMQNHTLQK